MFVTAKFTLMDAEVEIGVQDGYFVSAVYSNPYPFPLNFQVVDTKPALGESFTYMYEMKPMTMNEPLPAQSGLNVNDLFAKVLFARG